jgi:phage tail sheath protein FI
MPEYLAPGVFVEEVSYRAKSIEGVSTTTTGFVGPTRFGPIDVEPELVTGLGEFERIYGDRQQLHYTDPDDPDQTYAQHNYVWHAVRAFFENGGKRLYVKRVFGGSPDEQAEASAHEFIGTRGQPPTPATPRLAIRSRFPGLAGERRVRLTLDLGPNILAPAPPPAFAGSQPLSPPVSEPYVLRTLREHDVVWISQDTAASSPPGDRTGTLYHVTGTEAVDGITWTFTDADGHHPLDFNVDSAHPEFSHEVRKVTVTVSVFPALADDPDGIPRVWAGLALDPRHTSFGAFDSLTHQFHPRPENLAWRRSVPLVIDVDPAEVALNGLELAGIVLAHGGADFEAAVTTLNTTPEDRSFDLILRGGNDGPRPEPSAYEGDDRSPDDKTGLKSFEDLEEISIVAAPGATQGLEDPTYRLHAMTIIGSLITHAQRMQYRIAVLDSGDEEDLTQVQALRAAFDSKHAALYYPWVRVLDPVTQQEISLPPSGFVAGIFARNDSNRAVFKAPANEVVNLALGFERTLNKAQQEVLNPKGINCFRYFEGRGNRLWGARTISSDPEWMYVNLRRYFAYLERSIDVGTQWAVFEPNGPALWANVRRTVSDFLFNEFTLGAYVGDKPETSYFVRCDRSTMTQNDLDNGRLVCQVGVAVVKPAEFVIFRVGQWTATAKN